MSKTGRRVYNIMKTTHRAQKTDSWSSIWSHGHKYTDYRTVLKFIEGYTVKNLKSKTSVVNQPTQESTNKNKTSRVNINSDKQKRLIWPQLQTVEVTTSNATPF